MVTCAEVILSQIEFAGALLTTLRKLEFFEQKRPRCRWWYPAPSSFWAHLRISLTESRVSDREEDSDEEGEAKLTI